MTKSETIRYRLVDSIPREIVEGTIYISQEYATAVHKCCCGCRNEVVTPLGPTDWQIKINHGEVTVYPSIGNWSLPCQSHYWIREGRILWAEQWSEARIAFGRQQNRIAKQIQYGERPLSKHPTTSTSTGYLARLWKNLTKSWRRDK